VANQQPLVVEVDAFICAKVAGHREIPGYLREARVIIYD
jgi:hypothetical protein